MCIVVSISGISKLEEKMKKGVLKEVKSSEISKNVAISKGETVKEAS